MTEESTTEIVGFDKYEGPTISEHPYFLIEIKEATETEDGKRVDATATITTDGIFNAQDNGETLDAFTDLLINIVSGKL